MTIELKTFVGLVSTQSYATLTLAIILAMSFWPLQIGTSVNRTLGTFAPISVILLLLRAIAECFPRFSHGLSVCLSVRPSQKGAS